MATSIVLSVRPRQLEGPLLGFQSQPIDNT